MNVEGRADADAGRSVFVIFNPASGRGRRRRIRRYVELLRESLPEARHAFTGWAGEESDLADRALDEGYTTLVAVGGDGTWSHVADRIVASGRSDVRFGLLPSGTGNDFGRSVGIAHRSPEEAVRLLVAGFVRRVDVGRVNTLLVRSPTPDAPRGTTPLSRRHFLNLVGFGFDVAVIDAAAGARFLRGELLYKLTALQQLFRFPGFHVEVEDGDGTRFDGRHLMLTISNGRFFGGGFPIAPSATVTDGRLHACSIGDARPLQRLRLFDSAGKGRHESSAHVRLHASRSFRVRAELPPRFEVDGDVFRSDGEEVEVEVLPGALQVVAAPE